MLKPVDIAVTVGIQHRRGNQHVTDSANASYRNPSAVAGSRFPGFAAAARAVFGGSRLWSGSELAGLRRRSRRKLPRRQSARDAMRGRRVSSAASNLPRLNGEFRHLCREMSLSSAEFLTVFSFASSVRSVSSPSSRSTMCGTRFAITFKRVKRASGGARKIHDEVRFGCPRSLAKAPRISFAPVPFARMSSAMPGNFAIEYGCAWLRA